MATTSAADENYELITRRLDEVLGADLLKAILAEGKVPKGYWGTATTGRPHIGYFVPLTKIADFLRAGVELKVLLADVHAFLDNMKAPFELVAHRTKYYEFLLRAIFTSLGIPTSKLFFVTGSSYQLTPAYNLDNYKLCAMVSERDAKKAGAEVVKQVDNSLLSGLLYPGLQALDEQYLDVDFQFGGVDQRKIFTFAEFYLPKLGYKKRAHLMNAMVPSLAGGKMSSSASANAKIDFLDKPEAVRKKIKLAFCEEGNITENGLLSFVEAVLIPVRNLKREQGEVDTVESGVPEGTVFTVNRPEKYGGPKYYSSFADLQTDFANKVLYPADLKTAVADGIVALLEPIRKAFDENEEWQKIEALAYPDPNATVEKKKKKEKVYHPPPPGKGKTAQPVQAETPVGTEPDVNADPAVAHVAAEAAKQT